MEPQEGGNGNTEAVPVPPSGRQYPIEHGRQRATIVEIGAAIRDYVVDGVDVLDPFSVNEMSDGARGLPLVPWPNRLGDGRYEWDGALHQLPLTEPATGNAIHGLLGWRSWDCSVHEASLVVMQARLLPSPGYPFSLEVDIAYALSDAGLTVTTTARNIGARACPYGFGQHPYLAAGGGLIDDCIVELHAATRVVTDDERQLPVGNASTAGTFFDLSDRRPLGNRRIDHAFGDLDRDASGVARLRMTRPDGLMAVVWMDEHFRFLQLYTGDTLATEARRRGLAVEPMTCPPDAFRSGTDVVRLDPGESITTSWGVGLTDRR